MDGTIGPRGGKSLATAWRTKNLERARETERQYYQKKKEKIKLYNRRRYAALPKEARLALYEKTNKALPKSFFRAGVQTYRIKKRYPHLAETGVTTNELHAWLTEQFGVPCRYCGDVAYEIDHIVPLAKGGTHTLDNLQLLCMYCNRAKSDRTPEEFEAWILRIKNHR